VKASLECAGEMGGVLETSREGDLRYALTGSLRLREVGGWL